MLPEQPLYSQWESDQWKALHTWMKQHITNCRLCPRNCGANRLASPGACGQTDMPRLSNAVVHTGEEPPLIEGTGAGAVFFSGCSMHCVYCQNFGFSQKNIGRTMRVHELTDTFLRLQEQGVSNLDLVTPTPHLPGIVEAIQIGKERGLRLPIVYNTSSYESVETLNQLDGLVDLYLADIRYTRDEIGHRYSGVRDYWSVAQKALQEMYRQVGAKRMIVRMLVLPTFEPMIRDGLEFLALNLSTSVFISLMAQYFPVYKALGDSRIGRKLTAIEYDQAQQYLEEMGFSNGWVQEY